MITQKQRDAYRFALEDKGVPEVYAYMAAKNIDSLVNWAPSFCCGALVGGCFWWDRTSEGAEFWNAIYEECSLPAA